MDFSEFKGQEHVKRAIEVALAGNHYLVIIGGRGQGKSALLDCTQQMANCNIYGGHFIPENAHKNKATIAAMRACECGNYASERRECRCSPESIAAHRAGLGHANFDMFIEMSELEIHRLLDDRLGETSDVIMARVDAAISLRLNVSPRLDKPTKGLLEAAYVQLRMTPADFYRVLEVAKTIASLAGSGTIEAQHMAEAIQYRSRLEV